MRIRSIVSWLLLALALLQCAKLIVGALDRVTDLAPGFLVLMAMVNLREQLKKWTTLTASTRSATCKSLA